MSKKLPPLPEGFTFETGPDGTPIGPGGKPTFKWVPPKLPKNYWRDITAEMKAHRRGERRK